MKTTVFIYGNRSLAYGTYHSHRSLSKTLRRYAGKRSKSTTPKSR